MSIKYINPGPRMSAGTIHGSTVYLAGQVADNPEPDAKKQTASILAKIDALLKEAGTDKSKILSANIWLSDIRYFPDMNAVWDGWVAKGHTPARATVEARLAGPQYWVEIMVVAAI